MDFVFIQTGAGVIAGGKEDFRFAGPDFMAAFVTKVGLEDDERNFVHEGEGDVGKAVLHNFHGDDAISGRLGGEREAVPVKRSAHTPRQPPTITLYRPVSSRSINCFTVGMKPFE